MIGSHLPELLVVLAIALIFLGPKRLPEAGRGLGRAIKGFRDETKGLRDEFSSLKDDTHSLHEEVNGMTDTVRSTVTASVGGAGSLNAASNGSVVDRESSTGAASPLPVGANEDLLK